ncbi:MAG: ATP-binding protein [Candidatus Pacebacteria bacterium]|nr:ATP-binding protein [Candidatus Paceibacterota bacterium]
MARSIYSVIYNRQGELVYDDIPAFLKSICPAQLDVPSGNSLKFQRGSQEFRAGKLSSSHFAGILISDSRDYINSSHSFGVALKSMNDVLNLLQDIKLALFKDLIHNISTHHALTAQELAHLISEEELIKASSGTRRIDFIRDSLIGNFQEFGEAFLRILKNQRLLSADIGNLGYLHDLAQPTGLVSHPIHKVIDGIAYLYAADFTEKNVAIRHYKNSDYAPIEFESFSGALIPLFENAAKYTKYDSDFQIKYEVDGDNLIIKFEMVSIPIHSHEAEKIFNPGTSGEEAIRRHKQGKGLGLSHARKLLFLSGASIAVIPGIFQTGDHYATNVFEIKLPLR